MFVSLVKLENLLVGQGGYGTRRLRHAECAYYFIANYLVDGTRSVPTTLKAIDVLISACYDEA